MGMEKQPMVETDVTVIRNLIAENMAIASEIRNKAEALYCNKDVPELNAKPDSVGRVGLEFIDSLKAMRRILIEANNALIGFNG